MEKEYQIVQTLSKLPKHGLSFRKDTGEMMLYPKTEEDHQQAQYIELHVISDEEVKSGDKILDLISKQVLTCAGINEDGRILTEEYKNLSARRDVVKKIIATTDPELKTSYDGKSSISENWNGKPLPKIAWKVLEEYVKKPLEKVVVELERYKVATEIGIGFNFRPKVSDDALSIVISCDRLYTHDELKEKLERLFCDLAVEFGFTPQLSVLESWEEKNL